MTFSKNRAINDLTDRELENLTFDILQEIGMVRVVWRTPGADGGRDIECICSSRDASGHVDNQRWYIECKRYASSIDWPTIWGKIAHADVESADFLLIVTNSNPSPQCETKIEQWNSTRRNLKVRVWRGYELEQVISQHPAVALKYGLFAISEHSSPGFLALTNEVMKFAQSAYVAHALDRDPLIELEAAAALSELLTSRMKDLEVFGRIVMSRPVQANWQYDWLSIAGELDDVDETSARAIASTLRYITRSKIIMLRRVNENLEFSTEKPKFKLEDSSMALLRKVLMWTNLDLLSSTPSSLVATIRKPEK